MHMAFWKKTEILIYMRKMKKKFLIQMHSQAKMSCTKLPEVHGVRNELDSNQRPEKQHAMPKKA